MKLKKLFSLIISVIIVISMPFVCHASVGTQLPDEPGSDAMVLGEEQTGVSLEEAVAAARAFFNEYDELKFIDSKVNFGNDGKPAEYLLDFQNFSAGKKESVYAVVDTRSGEIRSFNISEPIQKRQNYIAEITGEEAVMIAEAFIRDRIGDTSPYQLVDNPAYGNDAVGLKNSVIYRLFLARNLNGILLKDCYYDISIDATNGKVVYFNKNKAEHSPDLLPSGDGVMSEEDAVKKYVDALDIQLQYITCYSNNIAKSFKPVYAPSTLNTNMIEAVSGNCLDYTGETVQAQTINEGSRSINHVPLNPEIVLDTRIINRDDVEDIVRGYRRVFEELTGYPFLDNREQDHRNCSYYDGQWYYEFQRYSDEISVAFSFTIQEGTGMITHMNLQFNPTAGESPSPVPIDREEGRAKAIDMLQKLIPGQYGFLTETTDPSIQTYPDELYYVFRRTENGILTPNTADISINRNTGMLSRFDFSWDEVEVIRPENIMTKEEAVQKYSETVNSALRYYFPPTNSPVLEKTAKIVYEFSTYGSIDASTGKHLDWKGDEILSVGNLTVHNLPDHPAKRSVELLAAHGFIDIQHVDYNKVLTRGDVIKILSAVKGFNTYGFMWEPVLFTDISVHDNIYRYIQNAINERVFIPEGDIFKANELIKKEEFSILLANLLGYSDISGQSDIFILDGVANVSDKGKGSAAILKALDLLPINEGEVFDGSEPVTLAEAAVVLYKALFLVR